MKNTKKLEGILVIDKPEGLTSTQALEEVKRILKIKKAGHGGTLDQIATGVLPIFLNSATKVAQIFLEGDKVYEGEFILGITTDTYDITGEKIEEKEVPNLSLEELQKIANEFVGKIKQAPPPYSAARFKGRRLYKYARNGLLISKEPKEVQVYDFTILNKEGSKVTFKLSCSKGTYVRALVNDIGKKIGCGAVLSKLKRIKKSIFTLEQAISIEDLKKIIETKPEEVEKLIIPVEKALEFLPKITISEEFAQKVRAGRQIYTTAFLSFVKFQKVSLSTKEKWVRLVTGKGKLVAIIENPLLSPSKTHVSYFRVFKN